MLRGAGSAGAAAGNGRRHSDGVFVGIPGQRDRHAHRYHGHLSTGTLTELNDLEALHTLLADHGWSWLTAVCTMLFSLFHWPCSTTRLTIRKESGGWKWTAAGMLIPTAAGGVLACLLTAACARGLGLAG